MKLSSSNKISIIIAIVSILVSVFFGSGWLKSRSEAKEQYKNGFLLPLQTILGQNKKIHNELTKEINLQALEYAPDYIQQEFNELDDSNPIKKIWLFRIETLLNNNDMAINLITSNIGSVKKERLKIALEKYIYQAQQFNDIWKLITTRQQIDPGMNPHTDLIGKEYPKELDSFLQMEIEEN